MGDTGMIRRAWQLLMRRSDVNRAVDDELSFHLEMTVEALKAEGLDEAAARRKAESLFGNVDTHRRECEEIGQRKRRRRQRGEFFAERRRDIRLTLRSLKKTPLFSAMTVLIIALGIGAVTIMFTVIRGVLLEPLPYRDPDGIIRLTVSTNNWGTSVSLSEPEYMALRTEAGTLRDVTVVRSEQHLLQAEEPHYVRSVRTSWELFPLLGVAPLYGRTYTAEDDLPGAEPVVVLSHAFWQEEGGSDPDLVGSSLILDGEPHTIIGIMPPEFEFPNPAAALWIPYRIDPADLNLWNNHYLWVYARLRDGVQYPQAQAEIAAMGEHFVAEHPEIYSDWNFSLGCRPLMEDVVGEVRTTLLLLLAATGFFLLITCLNVANLMVARRESRGRELAIRTALGASRRRLTILLLIESGLLAALGGILGFIVSIFGVRGVARAASGIVPRIQEVAVDPGVFLFALALTGVTVLLFGLLPLAQARGFNVQTQLREAGRALTGRRSGTRVRRLLIAAEVALSVVLVTGAVMMVRSLNNLHRFDLGYEIDDRLTMQVLVPLQLGRNNAEVAQFYTDLLERTRALPGIDGAAAVEYVPLTHGLGTWSIKVEGENTTTIGEAPGSYFLQISPDFFATMGIELVKGRIFTRSDDAGTRPVVIVNESFVRRHWPDGNAIGQRVTLFDDQKPWLDVVGVVRDARQESVLEEPFPCMYIPFAQGAVSSYEVRWWMGIILHGVGAAELAGPMRSIVRDMEPAAVVNNVRMMEEIHRDSLGDRALPASLLSLFSVMALLLALAGVYGLVAYLAAARRTEYGLHIALGARPGDVRRLVLSQGLSPVLLGVGIGLVAIYFLGSLVQQFLFGIGRLDPVSYMMVTALLTVAALAAGYLPAERSARIDPMQVLNRE